MRNLTANMPISTPGVVSTTPEGYTGNRRSKFADSIQKSQIVTPEVKARAEQNAYINYYQSITDSESLDEAANRLDTMGITEVERFTHLGTKGAVTKTDIAEGLILLHRYQAEAEGLQLQGRRADAEVQMNSALAMLEKLRELGTAGGQVTQAFSLMGRLTPLGMQMYAQRGLDQVKAEMQTRRLQASAQQLARLQLTGDELLEIRQHAERMQQLPDGYDKLAEIAEIQEIVNRKIPPTIMKRLAFLQQLNMLFNLRTQVRNVLGNAIMMPLYAVEDFVAGGLDAVVGKITGQRTTTNAANYRGNVQAFLRGGRESVRDWRRKINTRQLSEDRFRPGGPALGKPMAKAFQEFNRAQIRAERNPARRAAMEMSNVLVKMDRLKNFALDIGDRPFFEMYFAQEMDRQAKLKGTDVPTPDMVDQALQVALRRTWQDDNGMTRMFNGIRNGMNFGKEFGFGSIIIPFTKTPANILRATIEYSPASLIFALVKTSQAVIASRRGGVSPQLQRELVTTFAKGITGTLVMGLAAALAYAGYITGGPDDDPDVANFQKNVLGVAPYSFKIGDTSITYDWAQPVGGTFAITAEYIDAIRNGNDPAVRGLDLGDAGNVILQALSTGGNQLFEQSMLQGIADLFGNDNVMDGFLSSVIPNLAGQFIPSSLSQIAAISDPYARSGYQHRNYIGTAVGNAQNRIPGQRQTLPNVVDVMGQDVLAVGGHDAMKRFGNSFFNPAGVYPERASEAAYELQRVYNATRDPGFMPSLAPRSFVAGGQTYQLDNYEYADWQRATGSATERIVNELRTDPVYMKLSDEDKAKVLTDTRSYITSTTKNEYVTARGGSYTQDKWVVATQEAQAMGIPESRMILARYTIDGLSASTAPEGKTISNSRGMKVRSYIDSLPGLTTVQKQFLYDAFDVGQTVQGYTPQEVSQGLSRLP